MSRPGITFETAVPPLPETLPRMDVAAFVGFATRGPVGVPVPVEDVARFRDVFGPPLQLVRDLETGRMQTAHLGRAVTAFFRNGGRRCWIVRVAGPLDAPTDGPPIRRARFGLPGLVSMTTGRPSYLRARCYGASFDELRVGTVLRRVLLPSPPAVERTTTNGDGETVRLRWASDTPPLLAAVDLVAGDRLRLTVPEARAAFVAFATATPHTGASAPQTEAFGEPERGAVDTGPLALFYVDVPALSVPTSADVSVLDGATETPVTIERQTPAGSVPVEGTAVVRRIQDAEGRPVYTLKVPADAVANLEDSLVHVTGLGGTLVGWLQLGLAGTGETEVPIQVREALWPADPSDPTDPVDPRSSTLIESLTTERVEVERLRIDLVTWKDREVDATLRHLGLSARHPRAWTSLPTDAELFALQDHVPVRPSPETLRADAYDPRFPLAAPAAPGAEEFIPLGAIPRLDPDRTAGRLPEGASRSRLARERLSSFSPHLFVDDDLATADATTLARKADDKVFVREEPVAGIHSLWPIREVTLLAVPDAVHRGWVGEEEVEPTPASTPVLPEPDVQLRGTVTVIGLTWPDAPVDEAGVEVELQEADTADFASPRARYRGTDASVDRFVRSDTPLTLYFRYRLVRDGRPGAWSNTRRVDAPDPDFAPCTGEPAAPAIALEAENLCWRPLDPTAKPPLTYEMQVDTAPTFDAPTSRLRSAADLPTESIESGNEGGPEINYRWELPSASNPPPVRYVRVRARRPGTDAQGEQVGPWSATVAVTRPLRRPAALVPPTPYDDPDTSPPGGGRTGLLDLQASVLRFAAARGDVVAVLALPEHDRPDDARQHVTRLRTPGAVLGIDEERARSYGALYYPWLLGPAGPEGIGASPPDGAACGVLAGQTLRRGAWASPGNVPLAGAQAVLPPVSPAEQDDLDARHVNTFRRTAGRVLTLGTATLSNATDLTPISTRRLLILVRRLAEREGPSLVFQTHSRALRQQVAEQFDRLMRRLFRQGAFAGSTPREAYRVVADASVNPPEQVERGRLVVELQVAPARPLTFLTVRLVQPDGGGLRLVEGASTAPPVGP